MQSPTQLSVDSVEKVRDGESTQQCLYLLGTETRNAVLPLLQAQ